MKIAATVLDKGLDTSSGLRRPKCSFRVLDPKVKKFFEISSFYWIPLKILEKMMTCFWKLQLWFWTYGLIPLLDQGGSNAVSGFQTPTSKNILIFHDFIGFILWFWRKWCPVCENCSYGSGHIWLDTSSGPKWPRCSFRVNKFFEISWFYWIHLIILDKMMPCLSQLQLWFWSYGLIRLLGPSGPDVVSGSQTPRSKWWLVCEVGATVMDVWLTTSSGPKWPKCSFQVPDTNVKKYFDISWFYWIHLMILEKMMSCLWKLQLWFWTYMAWYLFWAQVA